MLVGLYVITSCDAVNGLIRLSSMVSLGALCQENSRESFLGMAR